MKANKNYLILFLIILSYSLTYSQGFVTLKGKQFYDGAGNPFYPVIMNYSPSLSFNNYPPTVLTDLDVNPHPHYGNSNIYENANGSQALLFDFQEIFALGFNTVRITLNLRRSNTPIHGATAQEYSSPCGGTISGSLFTFDWFLHSYDSDPTINAGSPNRCFAIQSPYSIPQNTNMQLYLQKLEEVISLAGQAHLKVILLTADGFDLFNGNVLSGGAITNQAAVDDYMEFLKVLTTYFANNTTIMAYDLDNEPHYKDGNANIYFRSKQEICNATTQLYNAIKTIGHDTNHLITIGLGDQGTLMNWDPEILKVDFVCLHLYPQPEWHHDFHTNNYTAVMEHATNRLFDVINWASNYIQRPWVIEEIGFNSTSQSSFPNNDWNWYGINGTFVDAANFINALLPVVKNCGVSGISWWNFQDDYESINSPSQCEPTDYAALNYREKCWGLLREGYPVGGDYLNANLEKLPRPTPFNSFDWNVLPTLCSYTPSPSFDVSQHYYDPYLNKVNNPTETNSVEGHIIDDGGKIVKGALVMGLNWLKTVTDQSTGIITIKNYWTYTYTGENGYFKLIPFNYEISNLNDNRLTMIRVVASGTKIKENGAFGNTQLTPSTIDFTLQRISMNYDEFESQPVPLGSTQNYKGWNSLTTSSIVTGNCNISARNEINLVNGFNAKVGETHIFTEETFADCPQYIGFRQSKSQITSVENDIINQKEISLTFLSEKKNFSIQAYPNPTSGLFSCKLINSDMDFETSIKIKDIAGKVIVQLISHENHIAFEQCLLSPGVYFIEAINNQNFVSTKLIVQSTKL